VQSGSGILVAFFSRPY